MQIWAFCTRLSYVFMRRKGEGITKTVLVMKLTSLLLLTAILQVSAGTKAQTVTYSAKDVPLTTVFSVIKKQTGYLFFYRKEDLATASPVSPQLKGVSLQQALTETLAGQPLQFSIQGNTIFITAKPTVRMATPDAPVMAPPPPPDSIYGRIYDSTGTPLSGASVMVKGTKRGTVTNARGEFTLKGIEPVGTVLTITYTGFARKDYKVKDHSRLYILMERSNDPLDDVQVVAYGTNTRRFSVGSSTVVTSEDIEKQPVTNVLMALQGRVPGMTVTPSSGAPNAYAQVQVRGQNTLNSQQNVNQQGINLNRLATGVVAYDQPMFIVDGVPLAAGNQNISLLSSLSGFTGLVPNAGLSSMGGLNPSDIESITVLKDADATSIYGSQGANGVIVITTKRGKPGKTNFNVKVNTGPNKVTKTIPMLNTTQYLAMRREAAAMDKLDWQAPGNSYLFPDLVVFDTTRNIDWFHRFMGGTANNTDAYASLNGGTTNSSFLLSGGYTKANFNYPGNFSDDRATLHSSFHYNSMDRRLTVDFGTDYSYEHNTSPAAPPSGGAAMLMAPDVPELINPNGSLIWTYKGVSLEQYTNQYSYLKQPNNVQSYGLTGSLRVAYNLARGLNVAVNMGYSRLNTKQSLQLPLSSNAPYATTASAQFANTDFQTFNVEPQVDYKITIGRGTLSALAGGTFKSTTSNGTTLAGSGYTNDALLSSIDAATTITAYDASTIYKYVGGFGRLQYLYDRKYILSLTGRRDGSSNFGSGRQFGSFGSVGAGWIFSEERGFQRVLPVVSYAKLSANYGSNGSDGASPYRWQEYWKLQTGSLFQGTRGYEPYNLANPNYSWSNKTTLNIGLDLGFFHDRLLFNATVYRARTSDQLVNYFLPTQTGFSNVTENLDATIQNQGMEFTINSVNIKTSKFRWTSMFNISFNRNKLLSFPGLNNSYYSSIYAVGKSTTQQYGFRYAGINDTTGVFEYYTSKGTKTSTPAGTTAVKGGDMVPIGETEPKYFGGLGNTFTYGGFSLTAFFRFTKKMGRNYLGGLYGTVTPGTANNLPTVALDHWTKPGDHAPMQRLTTGNNALASRAASYFTTSSGAYSDASFIRLQTVSLSYEVPANVVKKAGMKRAMFYVNAQNLLTITSYKMGDPETPGSLYGIPLQRIIVGGISLDF